MAKKTNGISVVNLGAGSLDVAKRIIGAKIGSEIGSGILGAAAGSRALTKGIRKNGKKGK